jgi:hypothetical protein
MRLFISEKNHIVMYQRKLITIVHDEILSNVRFVIKILEKSTNLESTLQLFMMRTS